MASGNRKCIQKVKMREPLVDLNFFGCFLTINPLYRKGGKYGLKKYMYMLQFVICNNVKSNPNTKYSQLQGSILEPTLSLIYINDITVLFADDSSVSVKNKNYGAYSKSGGR